MHLMTFREDSKKHDYNHHKKKYSSLTLVRKNMLNYVSKNKSGAPSLHKTKSLVGQT